MIRVLIKASSHLARAGLKSLLRSFPGLRGVGDAGEDGEGTDAAAAPDVVLAEAATLADPIAREAFDWARQGAPVVLLMPHPAAEPVAEALRAGIKPILPDRADGPEIAAAIEAASAGLVVLDAAALDSFLPAASGRAIGPRGSLAEELTPREREVLRLVAAGLGNKEIASRLKISGHTVKFHVASIMGKLGASSRTEAVTLGIRQGLIMI